MQNIRFRNFHGAKFPIPMSDYQGNKKHRILQRFIIALLNKYEIGNRHFKWLTSIDRYSAAEMLERGVYITESRFGSSLFHGVLSHMLQNSYIIICHST